MSSSGDESEERMENVLDCPICMEFMEPPILLCQSGHSICSSCRSKLERCPTCRRPFIQVRNFALEEISRRMLVTCGNAGCEESFPKSLISDHMIDCVHGGWQCPFFKYFQHPCSFSGSLQRLRKHLLTVHENRLMPNSETDQISNYNFFQETASRVIVTSEDIFYVIFDSRDRDILVAVMYVGPRERSSDFKYELRLSRKNREEELKFCLITHSYFENVNDILRPGNCIALHQRTVSRFTSSRRYYYELSVFPISRIENDDSCDYEFE